MQFDPRAGIINTEKTKEGIPYYLAIAMESPPGMTIYDATSESTIGDATKRYLFDEIESAHDMGGVRAVSYSSVAYRRDDNDNNDDEVICSTLGMDGRLCLWNVSGVNDPTLGWDLLHRDDRRVVSKIDVGEYLGSDVGDRSSFPVWSHAGVRVVLAIPGERDLQLRRSVHHVGELENHQSKIPDKWPKKDVIIVGMDGEGHKSDIVSIAFDPEGRYVVTGGRDNKICLWELFNYAHDKNVPGRFVTQIGIHDCLCTHMLWMKLPGEDQYAKSIDVLCMALEDGSMLSVKGKDNIVPPSSVLILFLKCHFITLSFFNRNYVKNPSLIARVQK